MADKLINRKKLLKYLPDFMKQFVEMKEINQAGDKEFQHLDGNIERLLNNAFIEDCDEYGIQKYENLLGITPNAEDTLDSRKSRVLLRWNDYVPYTYRVLVNRLNTFCGVNNYTITGDQSDYYLHFETRLELFGQVKELEDLFERILPENMYYESMNSLDCQINGNAFIGAGVCYVAKIIMTNDFKDTVSSNGSAVIGVGSVVTDMLNISEDFKETVSVNGNAVVAGGLSTIATISTSNDFNDSLQSNGQAVLGAGTVSVDFVEIESN